MADTQQNTEPKKPKQPKQPKVAKEAGEAAPKVKKPRVASDYKARLRTHFEEVIRAELTKQFGYKNRMQVPMITKVVLNMGIGEGVADRKKVDNAANDLALIAGQKAVITCRASRSPPTSCATARPSAAKSRCARLACTTSSTGW